MSQIVSHQTYILHCSPARFPPRDANGPQEQGACIARQKLVGRHHVPKPFPSVCVGGGKGWAGVGAWVLRMTCARSLLGEPDDTLDEESCSDMPSWLASPGCRLNLARPMALALGLCKVKPAGLGGEVHVCRPVGEGDLVRPLILIEGMYVMPNRCPCPM